MGQVPSNPPHGEAAIDAVAAQSSAIDALVATADAEKRAQEDGLRREAEAKRRALKAEMAANRPPTEKEWLHEGLDKVLDPAKREQMMAESLRKEKKAKLEQEKKLATLPEGGAGDGSGVSEADHAFLAKIDGMRADFRAADEEAIQPHDRVKKSRAEDNYRNKKYPQLSAHKKIDGVGGDLPLVKSSYDEGDDSSGASSPFPGGSGGKGGGGGGLSAAAQLAREAGAVVRPDGSYVMMGPMNTTTQANPHTAKGMSFSLCVYYADPFQYVDAALKSGIPKSRIVLPKDCGYTLEDVLTAVGHGGHGASHGSAKKGQGSGGSPRSPTRTTGLGGDDWGRGSSYRFAAPTSSPSAASFRRRAASSSPTKRSTTNLSTAPSGVGGGGALAGLSGTHTSQGLLRETLASISRKESAMQEVHGGIYHPTKTLLARDTGRLHTQAWDPRQLPLSTHTRSPKTLVNAGASAASPHGSSSHAAFFFGEDSSIGPQEDKRLIRVQSHEIESFKDRALKERDQGRQRILAPIDQSVSPSDRAKLVAEERAAFLKLGSADGTGAGGVLGRRAISPERLAETVQGAAGVISPIIKAGAAALSFSGPTSTLTGFGAAGASGSSPVLDRPGKRLTKAPIEAAREARGIGGLDLSGKGGPSDQEPRRGRKRVESSVDARSSEGVASALNAFY